MSGSEEVSGPNVYYARGQRRRFGRAQANAARLATEALRIAQAAAAAANALQGSWLDGALQAARRVDDGTRLFESLRRGSDGGRSGPNDRQRPPAVVAASGGQMAAVAASGGQKDGVRPAWQPGPLLPELASAQTQHAIGSGPVAPAVHSAFVSVIQGARGTLVGSVGGLSSGQLNMALAALDLAGPGFLPDAKRLEIMRGCSSGFGHVAGLDLTMLGAVSILQGGGTVTQAARFLRPGLSSHACDGACRQAHHPSSRLVDTPSERPALPPSRRPRTHLRNVSRLPSPGQMSKRQRGAAYPRTRLVVDVEGATARD